jgi:hypothetical protein
MSTKTFSKSQMVLKPYNCNMDLSNTSKISIRFFLFGNSKSVYNIILKQCYTNFKERHDISGNTAKVGVKHQSINQLINQSKEKTHSFIFMFPSVYCGYKRGNQNP